MVKKKAGLSDAMAKMKVKRDRGKINSPTPKDKGDDMKQDGTKLKNLNARMPEDFVKTLKKYCIDNDLKIQDVVYEALLSHMRDKI